MATRLVAAHFTRTGVAVPALILTKSDSMTVPNPCVWCMSTGNGRDEDDPEYYLGEGTCGACGGTGVNGTITAGELKEAAWKDMVFDIDARRYELMDRDCCPDCGAGGYGCQDEDSGPCRVDPRLDWVVDAITGEEIRVLAIPA